MKNFDLYVDKGQDVVIWGLGFYGMNCLDFLQKVYDRQSFCDCRSGKA